MTTHSLSQEGITFLHNSKHPRILRVLSSNLLQVRMTHLLRTLPLNFPERCAVDGAKLLLSWRSITLHSSVATKTGNKTTFTCF